MVQAAKSGHPGAPMGCAPMAHVLYAKQMHHSPSNPEWFNRDRFVLSNGHACALQVRSAGLWLDPVLRAPLRPPQHLRPDCAEQSH